MRAAAASPLGRGETVLARLIEPTAKARTAGGRWRIFAISEDATPGGVAGDLGMLLLAPVVSSQIDGRPLEEVLFVRDEMADMAWAIERVVTGASGTSMDRTEQWNRASAASARSDAGAGQPRVPPRDHGAGSLDSLAPRARWHESRRAPQDAPLRFYEEVVPREGRRVQRIPMLARWSGGKTATWIGRRSRIGRGEGASGLRYDVAEET